MREDRLRKPPRERFAGAERVCDLEKVFSALPGESVARQGHMQKTLHKHGRLTSAVFAFDEGARLESHRVDGEAVLHVLEGRLGLVVDGMRREVGAGQLVLLDPGVEHALEALEPSRILMHVVLERPEG